MPASVESELITDVYDPQLAAVDQLIIVALEVDATNKLPFAVCKLLCIHSDQSIEVQWYGNFTQNMYHAFLPGWVEKSGTKYYKLRPLHASHVMYTNLIDYTPLSVSNIVFANVNLNEQNKLPISLLALITKHPSIVFPTHLVEGA